MPFGFGPMELLIILIILVLSVGVPVALLVWVVRRQGATGAVREADVAVGEPPVLAPARSVGWSRGQVYALGAATAWPVVYTILFVGVAGVMLTSMSGSDAPPAGLFECVLPLHLFTILVSMALLGFYIWYVVTDPAIDRDSRVVWIIAIVLAAAMAELVAYYLLVYKPWRSASSADDRAPSL